MSPFTVAGRFARAASPASNSDRSSPRSPDRGCAGPAGANRARRKTWRCGDRDRSRFPRLRGRSNLHSPRSGSITMKSGPSSTVTPSLRSSRVGAAMRSHSLTRSVARPVMRVGVFRNGASIISVGATSGMLVMSTAPSKPASRTARPFDDGARGGPFDARAELFAQRRRIRSRPGACSCRDC